MQRLYLDDDEKITRREYLRRKKKQAKQILKKRSKITYFMISFILLLSIYVFIQLYIYKQHNNYTYIEGEGISDQKVYNVFYITEGYTYNPTYSLNKIQTNGFGEKVVLDNCGLSNIQVDSKYIYGIKDTGIYRINKENNEMEMLVEKDVLKYKVFENDLYYTCGEKDNLCILNTNDLSVSNTEIDNVCEILVDKNYIFLVRDEKTKKILVRYDRKVNNKLDICTDANVSYIIQDDDSIYFVNKKDSNKIYMVSKNGGYVNKLSDVCSMSDKGQIKEIDGSKYMFVDKNQLYYINVEDNNTLWKIDLNTKENTKVISVAIEILQNAESTVFYKIKNEMGVYLFNYSTNFMSQVSKRKIKEFFVDTTQKVETNIKGTEGLNRN